MKKPTYMKISGTALHVDLSPVNESYSTNTKKRFMKNWLHKSMLLGIVMLIANLIFMGKSFAQTTYYYKGTGALNTVGNWGTATNGTGTAPASFTANNQIFNVRNVAAVSNAGTWTVSGTGSKITVGDGISATNLTIPSGTNTIAGTVDVSAGATLTLTNTTLPTLGALNATSTVVYNATAAQAITAVTYGNLTYSGSSTATLAGSCSIGGNFSCTSGNVTFNSTNQDRTFTVTGSFSSSTTGTVEFGSGNGHSLFNLSGNFSKTNGTMTTTGNTENGLFNMLGTTSTIQSTATGTALKWTDFTIPNGSTCTINGDFTETGSSGTPGIITVSAGGTLVTGTASIIGANSTFILSTDGTLQIGSSAGITSSGATGNVQTTTRTFGAGGNYVYNGTSAQATGTGFPTNLTGDLTINNSGNTVTLSAARTITSGGTINLTAGVFAAGSSLTMATTSNFNRSEGSLTGTLQGTGKYNVTYTGSSKTTGPELLNTGLNNLTINETAASNTVTSGNAFTSSGDLTVTQGNLIIQGTDASYTATGNLVVSTNGTFTHSVNWDVSGKQFNVGGNIDVTGLITYTVRSHISMTGTSKTLKTGTTSGSALSILTLSGATVSASGTVTINDNFWAPFNSAGSFSTNGQTVSANAGILIAGGTVNVNGGSLTVVNGISVGVGATGAGTLNVSSGTLTADGIQLGDIASTVANSITQSGGTFNITGGITINQPAANTLTNAWNINAQTATVAGLISFAGTTTATNRIGSIVLTTGTLNANGGISFAGTTSAFKVINLGTTGTVNMKAALSNAANATLTSGTSGSTFNYNDNSAAQTVNFFGAGSYNNLHINTTGGTGATLGAAVTAANVTGNLRVQSGTLNNGGFAIAGVSGKTFEVANGATFILGGTSSAFPTVFTPSLGSTGTVNYAGSGAQIVSAQSYGNLTTSNTSGLTMTGNSSVATTLTFTSGKITTGANTLTLASGASISGAGSGKYVYGNLAWTFPTGTPTRTFEIGDAGNYTPVTVAYTTAITTGGTLTAFTTAGDYSPLTGSGFAANRTVNRTWTLTNSGIAPATPGFGATFNFIGPTPGSGDIDALATPSNFVVRRFAASSWNATTAGTRTSTSTEATAINGYGVFQVGEICVAPTISTPSITNISCNGSTDGAIDITTTGGTTPFTYAWTGPGAFTATTEDISGLAAGNYSLTITATGGCTVSSGTLSVTQPAVLSATVTPTNISCNGSTDGSIVISSATGGYGTYEYSINGGTSWQSGGSFTGLSVATYNVKIRDAAHTSCIVTLNASLSITQPAVLSATVTPTNISCNGSTDGSIVITSPSGGYGTYQYTINGGTNWQTSGNFTGLSAASYNVKIRDAAQTSCVITLNGSLTITAPAVLSATVTPTNISCNGSTDGSIIISSPSGGYGTYQYTINGGTNWQTSGNFTGLSSGTYNVKIRDAAHTACIVTLNGSLTITAPAVLSATVTPTNISCNGSTDGSIVISSPSGGYGTYQYTINGGTNWQASGNFTGLSAGTFNVKIRDAAQTSCIITLNGSLTITAPAVLSATVTPTNISCNGSSDGSIIISSPSGGYGTYQYTINGGTNWQTSGNFTGLSAGTYNVKIRDAAQTACIITLNGSLTITAPAVLSATVTPTNISCNGSSDGSIIISSPSGGYGTYQYTINGGTSWQSIGNFTGLSASTYNVQIRDAAHTSCIVTLDAALVITEPAALNATVNSANVTCNGASDGTISITSPTGGSGTYEYTINGGSTWLSSGSFTSLAAGNYNLQIRDAAHTSCVVILDAAYAITEPAVLAGTVASVNISCNGSANGTITISSASGGYGTYEFSADGGTSWQSSGSFTGLSAGTYNVRIRDAAHVACELTLDAALVITEPVILSAGTSSSNIDCNGAGNGSITISSASGGYGNYEYSIDGGTTWQSSGNFTALSAGSYNVQIRDADHIACVITLDAALVITEAAILSAVVNSTEASCGINNGTISIASATGGSGTYEYSINGGTNWQPSGNFTGLAGGSYNVQIRDAALTSCIVILDNNYIVNQVSIPGAPASGGNQSVCSNGDPEQTITATATGGTITWYTAATGGTIVSPPSLTGVGTVTYYAEASSGACVSATRTAVSLTILAAPAAPVSGGDQTVCANGDPMQTLTATASSSGSITWFVAATGGSAVTPALIGVGTATFYAEAFNGSCSSPSRTPVTLRINPVLATPGTISGPLDVCPLVGSATPSVYSISPVSGATFYTWSVPPGATIVSGQGTTSLSVTFDNSYAYTNQFFTVDAEASGACTSGLSSLEVLKVLPGIPTSINGPTDACPYIGSTTNAVYSIAPVTGATSYTWTLPNNTMLVSGQGTLSVQVSFLAGFTSGSIKVAANSNCGARAPRSLSILKVAPVVPGAITGPMDACAYIGTATQLTYSIDAVPNATSYNWSVPAHVTLVSGQGTTTINVTFNAGYTASLIRVRSVSNCASSGYQALSVGAAVTTIPGVITGPANACQFIGTGLEGTYTIRKVDGANSYIWSVPAGASVTAHPGGSGVNDTIVRIAYNSGFVAGTDISVQAVSCLPSAARTLTVTRILIAQPGLISTVSINVCPYMASATNPSGTPVLYTIRKMSATSYNWTAPAGATITAHPNGTGVNDTTVEITYSSAFISGDVTVAASNNCGPGPVRTLGIISLRPGAVGGITTAQSASCPNRQYTYTIASLPTNASSILWTVPAGGTITSGQGSLSITVSYTSAAINGAVTATGYNNCGNSTSPRSLTVKLMACTGGRSAAKTNMTAAAVPYEIDTLKINVFPNPSVSDFNLQVITAGKETINVRIVDMQGRGLKIFTVLPYQNINVGADLKAGSYMMEVSQGGNKAVQKILKF